MTAQEQVVCFAYGKNIGPNTLMPGRPELTKKLAQVGIDSVVTHSNGGKDKYDFSDTVTGWQAAYTNGQMHLHNPKTISVGESVGVVINHYRTFSEQAAPLINEGSVRRYGLSKALADEELFSPLGLGIPTHKVTSEEEAHQTAAQLGGTLVVKPSAGTFGNGVAIIERGDVADWAKAVDPEKGFNHVMQPFFDFTVPFPAEMKPYTADERERFDAHNAPGRVKELRMYAFTSPSGASYFPIVRASDTGNDRIQNSNWFFVDPDTVPSAVYENSAKVVDRLSRMTGATAMYIACDWGYGSAHPSHDPDWQLVEANLRTPYLLGYDKHPDIAERLHTTFTGHIIDTVLHK